MISVNDPRRMNWDLMIITLALYNCAMIPLNVAFHTEIVYFSKSKFMNTLERVIDVFFFLDIILNCRTTFINPKTNIEILDQKRVFITYFKSIRFFVDMLASIPFDQLIENELQ